MTKHLLHKLIALTLLTMGGAILTPARAESNVNSASSAFSANGDVTGSFTQKEDFTSTHWNLAVTWKSTASWQTEKSKIGTGNAPATEIVLTGTGIPGTISDVIVNTYGTSSINATVAVTVGGTAFKRMDGISTTADLTADAKGYSFSGSGVGNVVLTWTNNSDAAIYIKSITITYSAFPVYTITPVSNNESYGSVSLTGTTITATPKEGCRVKGGTDGYTVTSGTATVTNNGDNTFSVSPASDCTVQINFEEKPHHDVCFLLSGGAQHAKVSTEEGADIAFPEAPDAVGGRDFMGWVATAIDGTTDTPPTFVTSAIMGDADVTYYACYAIHTPGDLTIKTDKLTTATFGSPSSYTTWTGKQATSGSDAVYAGKSKTYNDNAIQIEYNKDSGSGIVTTTSGGKVKKVAVTWNVHTSSVSKCALEVYGKNSPYTEASDLYNPTPAGDLLGEIVYGTSKVLEINGDYEYLGLRASSSSSTLYLYEIDIDWTVGTPDSYSGYCTTVPLPSVAIGSAGFTTYVAAGNVSFPTDVTAYIATAKSGSTLTLTEVSAVPTGTPVVVKGSAGSHALIVAEPDDCEDVTQNLLSSSDGSVAGDGSTIYALGIGKNGANEGKIGFYLVEDNVTIPEGKAYLRIDGGNGIKEFIDFSFAGKDPDGIWEIHDAQSITHSSAIHDLQGRRMTKMQRGIHIVDGKKVLKWQP